MTTIEFSGASKGSGSDQVGAPRSQRHSRRTRAAKDFSRRRMWVVARTDLRQLIQSKDYWIPMVALGSLFFFVIPTVLLITITSIGDINVVQQASQALKAALAATAADRAANQSRRWRRMPTPSVMVMTGSP